MLPRAIWGEGVPKPTGNAPRGGSIEGRPNFFWVISGDLDWFKRARVLGFIRPVAPLARAGQEAGHPGVGRQNHGGLGGEAEALLDSAP
jgi:hypothetical protein